MPREIHRSGYPAVAASAVNAGAAVTVASGSDSRVAPVATANVRPLGIALATGATVGLAVTVLDEGNTAVVTVGASVGRGAEIGVASTNGALGPVAGASGSVVYSVGQSVSAGDADQDISLYVNPRQLSGLV